MKFVRHSFILALVLAWVGTAQGQPVKNLDVLRNGPKVAQVFRPVVAKASEATVRVLADGKEVALGAIVDSDGFILTKWSEIKDKGKIVCKLKDGRSLDAKVVGVKDDTDAAYDLAMLQVDAKDLPTVAWRDSKDAKVGRWVASVGAGADPVGVGVVSVARRLYKAGDQPPKTVNANAGYLGVGLEAGMGGARITAVSPKTPAEKAGLKVNDIVYEAAGRPVIDHESLINTVQRLKPGDDILLKVRRGEEELELKATLGKLPKQLLGNPQETMGARLSNRRGGFPAILQHDSGLKPEDCGGPLVDLDGKAVGINIARAGRTETYAIPSEDFQPFLSDLKSGKLAPTKQEAAQTDPATKNPDVVLRTVGNLNAKDKLSSTRKGRFTKVHEVQLSAGMTYSIEMDSSEIDSFLILEDAKGNKLAEDDDSGGYPNAKIVFTPKETGTYRVIASSFDANETGNYTLLVRRQSTPAPEKTKK